MRGTLRKKLFCLILTLTLALTNVIIMPATSYGASTASMVTVTDEAMGLSYQLYFDEDANLFVKAKISDGASFVGGKLPDTVSYGGNEYPITELGFGAFRDYTGSVTGLPAYLVTIGNLCFYQCTGLELAKLPEGVMSIGQSCFSGCTNLALTELPDSLKSIGSNAFYACSNCVFTDLPEEMEEIGDSAFRDCSKLKISNFPKGIDVIGQWVFYNCTSLTSINIPEGVTEIGFEAFRGCTSLKKVKLPDSLLTIESQSFMGCMNLELTSLPPNVTSVGYEAFWDCDSITYLALGDAITDFSTQCFSASATTKSYPDVVMNEGTVTWETMQAVKEDSRTLGNLVSTWDATQDSLDANTSSYILGTQTVDGDYTLAAGKHLVITGNGALTITGNLTVESGAELIIDVGGVLTVTGAIINYGTITNQGTVINQGTIDNQGVMDSSEGTISGEDIAGNEPLLANIEMQAYVGVYDAKPHPTVTMGEGLERGDLVSYSTTYNKYHETKPELVEWSESCPEYTTVSDADSLVTVKVERIENDVRVLRAINTVRVVITKAKLEVKEAPVATAIIEGDTLSESALSGGRVVFEGTDDVFELGKWSWDSFMRDSVPVFTDGEGTPYRCYYNGTGELYNCTELVYSEAAVKVIECLHENTGRGVREGWEPTCAQDGATEEIYCEQCKDILTEREVIPMLGHSWDSGVVTLAPAAGVTGVRTYTCAVCQETKTEEIPALPPEEDSETENTENEGTPESETENTGNEGTAESETENTQNEGTAESETGNTQNGGAADSEAGNTENGGAADSEAGNTENEETTESETGNTQNGGAADSEAGNTENGGAVDSEAGNTENGGAADSEAGNTENEGTAESETGNTQNGGAADSEAGNTENGGNAGGETGDTQNSGGTNNGETNNGETNNGGEDDGQNTDDALWVGQIIKDSKTNGRYKVTKVSAAGGSVCYQKPLLQKAEVKIPSFITYGNKKLKVTSIAADAFKNNKKVKKVTIGSEVSQIGEKAFYGCKKLNYICFKTKKLTLKKVGAKAFSNIKTKKIKITVPKKKAALYKKILSKRGMAVKKMQIKKTK